MVNLVNQMTSK